MKFSLFSSRANPPARTYNESAADGWESTRAQTALATQLLRRDGDEPETGNADIGRRLGPDELELFIACAPAEAMQQQIEHLQPDYIAVHDIGTRSSRRLLAGVAAAAGRTVQKLQLRRQGHGQPLATIEFLELSTDTGGAVRLYSTDIDADTAGRAALARTLLAHSRLAVVMVGDLPAAAMAAALKPLHDDMLAGPWTNRHLLLLPLASANTLAGQGNALNSGTPVTVRTTPQVQRPADAWSFIQASWIRVRDQQAQDQQRAPEPARYAPGGIPAAELQLTSRPPAAAASQPLTMRPMPAIPSARAPAASGTAAAAPRESLLDLYVGKLAALTGAVGCCVFEIASGRIVAYAAAGASPSPSPEDLGRQGMELLTAMNATSRALGCGHALPDAAITLGTHHLLLRGVPKNPGMALHVALDKAHANVTLVRLQVARLDALFDDPPH